MMILGERGIYNALGTATILFRQNLEFFVNDIYAQETSANISQILTWWSDTSNAVVINYGYPFRPVKVPMLAITTEPEQLVPDLRFIGQHVNQVNGSYVHGTIFQSQYNVHILGLNQDFVYWLQIWTKWALMIMTQYLINTYGMIDGIASLGPLRPVPDSLRDAVFPFERVVTYVCKHNDTWTFLPISAVTQASVMFQSELEDESE